MGLSLWSRAKAFCASWCKCFPFDWMLIPDPFSILDLGPCSVCNSNLKIFVWRSVRVVKRKARWDHNSNFFRALSGAVVDSQKRTRLRSVLSRKMWQQFFAFMSLRADWEKNSSAFRNPESLHANTCSLEERHPNGYVRHAVTRIRVSQIFVVRFHMLYLLNQPRLYQLFHGDTGLSIAMVTLWLVGRS